MTTTPFFPSLSNISFLLCSHGSHPPLTSHPASSVSCSCLWPTPSPPPSRSTPPSCGRRCSRSLDPPKSGLLHSSPRRLPISRWSASEDAWEGGVGWRPAAWPLAVATSAHHRLAASTRGARHKASLGGLLPRLQHELQLEPSQTGIPWTAPGSEPLESCSLEQFSPHGAAKH
jgi:hypothetical protein